jgi:asparagine synthase (glutamine-hydrolysing)
VQQTMRKLTGASTLHKMMYVDTKHWLADSHLIMMDKMSMANSIEARTPMLDHRLVELVASMPESFKINLFRSKILFKNAFSSEMPRATLKRSKRGFSTPLNLWLHSCGYELIEANLNQKNLTKYMFKKAAIDELLALHQQNRGDFSASIFTLLVLGMWITTFLDNK